MAEQSTFLIFILSAWRISVPLSFGAMGGYFSERSGTINLALEGMMLLGAFSAAAIAHATHNPWLGLAGGIAGALTMAVLHAFLSITLKADQVISGMAVNFIAAGLPPVLCKAFYDASGGTPLLENAERIRSFAFANVQVSPLMLLNLLLLFVCALVHYRTTFGQYVRFAGEHPSALLSQGIQVRKIRWIGVLISGVFCGLGGTYLSIDHGGAFTRNMTAGRGFIALAALIIGRWNPVGAFLGAILFGAIEAAQILLQGYTLPSGQTVPVQWIQMLPYIATLFILAGFAGNKRRKSGPPKALGVALQD